MTKVIGRTKYPGGAAADGCNKENCQFGHVGKNGVTKADAVAVSEGDAYKKWWQGLKDRAAGGGSTSAPVSPRGRRTNNANTSQNHVRERSISVPRARSNRTGNAVSRGSVNRTSDDEYADAEYEIEWRISHRLMLRSKWELCGLHTT